MNKLYNKIYNVLDGIEESDKCIECLTSKILEIVKEYISENENKSSNTPYYYFWCDGDGG